VGVLGTAVVYALKTAALDAAIDAAIAGGEAEGVAAGDIAGAAEVIRLIKKTLGINELFTNPLGSFISETNYNQASYITSIVNMQYRITCKRGLSSTSSICDTMEKWNLLEGPHYLDVQMQTVIGDKVTNVVTEAKTIAEAVAKTATENVTKEAIKT
ncbi:hypothetical protein PFDG_00497, partial [Plasmodium falciparum Dd2]